MTEDGDMQPMTIPALYWLTRDFRFSDNAALTAALSQGPVLAVFVLDQQTREQGAASRWRLQRALEVFDAELRRRSGNGVLVVEGEAEEVFPALMRQTGARQVHQNDWPRPSMRQSQRRLSAALGPLCGELHLYPGHLLASPQRIRTGQGGVYKVFTPFARALRHYGVDRPLPGLPDQFAAVPLPESVEGLRLRSLRELELAPDLHRGHALLERFALPAGEAAAFDRLEDFFDRAAPYPEGRDRPDIDACSGLSEHLALGEISPRSLWALASLRADVDSSAGPGAAAAAGLEKFLSEVIWREFAWHLLIDFPQLETAPWRGEWAEFPWRGAGPELERWQRGDTGIAMVDAGLREMWVTGRMHNRVRMVVASWLTKHLLIDWRLGMQHFADCLTDWDPASNAMNWQWVAGCGPDASPFFRIFNPETQAQKFDPKALYRAKWLAGWPGAEASPEAGAFLENLPSDWRPSAVWRPAPAEVLKAGRLQALEEYRMFKGAEAEPREEDGKRASLNFLRDFM